MMKKSFLEICSPPDSSSAAHALLTCWQGYDKHLRFSLLLEAINQFAVRYTTMLYPCDAMQRYLPAMVEHYECFIEIPDTQVMLEGNIEPHHGSLRVVCLAWSDRNRSRLVADAAVVVHPVALPEKVTSTTAEDAAIPLWQIMSHSEKSCIFRLNGGNPLFSEHFPGNPLCPGSLLVDLIVSTFLPLEKSQRLKLQKVKFLRAVHPEQDYRLVLSGAEVDRQASFIITSARGERHVSGSYSRYRRDL